MKPILASILFATLLIIGSSVLTKNKSSIPLLGKENVSIIDGKQIVTLTTKGGYQPNRSLAKANIPTVIRFETSGTFDCSSSLRIPSMNISKLLPSSGTTDIDIGVQPMSTLKGSCSMGMYPFEIIFEE